MSMKLTRYEDTAPVDYMILADDGAWVPASEALELEARVRELEADVTYALGCQAEALTAYNATEARLATATALIRDWTNFDFDCPDEHDEDTGEEGEDGAALERLYERSGAFLAGQPAAPRCACQFEAGDSECPVHPICPEHEVPLVNHGFFKCGCRYVQPAAPEQPPCADCGSTTKERSCCPLCGKGPFCQDCSERPVDCCDPDDQPAAPYVYRNQAGDVIDGQTEVPGPAPARTDEGCECPGAHECGVTTSTVANERKARAEAESRAIELAYNMGRADGARAELARRGLKP